MNQGHLYATLIKAGCKIIAFEDFPAYQGSWRVSFIKPSTFCEISSNRVDGYMSLKFNSEDGKSNKSVINSLKFLTDEAELTTVIRWLRSIVINITVTNNAELPAVHV